MKILNKISYFRTPFEISAMTIKSTIKVLALSLLTAATFSSCEKTPDYVQPVYLCGCGDMTWKGTNAQLNDANYILSDETEDLSRRYYVTANMIAEGEEEPHSVNLWIEIPNVEEGVFHVDDDTFEFTALAHEVNQNDPILPVREFLPIEGVITVSPAFLGGTETVGFNFIMRESYDGDLVGVQFGFSGSFTVNVEL